jgi:hypothetical protein
MEELGWLLKTAHIEDWTMPISVTCSGLFKDKNNTPDLSNLSKCILDGIEELTGINDQNFRWHDGAIWWNKAEEPMLTITVKEERTQIGQVNEAKQSEINQVN